jgi:ATP-dependent helicase/nuclease subunit A
MKTPPDQADRLAAVRERERTVVIDAGAGTGKTTTLVRRVVELVAPEDDSREAVDVSALAAITFTRRAAGELAQRIRSALANALQQDPSPTRKQRLEAALGALDTAYIGTIHSFADRLLRELADVSGLGPQYEILEEVDELTEVTTSILLQGAARDRMMDVLEGTTLEGDDDLAAEATETLRAAQRAQLRSRGKDHLWGRYGGIDDLFKGFCTSRDVPPELPPLADADLKAVNLGIKELRTEVNALTEAAEPSPFGQWLVRFVARAEKALASGDPARVFAAVSRELDRLKSWGPKNGDECGNDTQLWFLRRRLTPYKPGKKDPERGKVPYDRENLRAPLQSWMATRLVRVYPVVIAVYEQLKAARQGADHIDLLLRLRNVLRDDPGARKRCQGRLARILVDEFQDTDPLQAEIVMFLVEDGQSAKNWEDVTPLPGKLTIVGDPKQSIYRFRRADVTMYDEVRTKLLKEGDAVRSVELAANFRSVPPLIEWLNERCENLLGAAPDEETRFDPDTGQVYQRDLMPGRQGSDDPAVEVLPLDPPVGASGKPKAGTTRALAAEAVAKRIRLLLDDAPTIFDPHTKKERPLIAGDIAVLTPVTTTLAPIFEELDRYDVPYSMSGGRLFLSDPLHQRFLLALRGLAGFTDSAIDDGAALAALYSPPLFGLDLRILAAARAETPESGPDPYAKARAHFESVASIVKELRARRNQRTPGHTARLLLQESGLARYVSLLPNGPQRLSRLRELCHLVEMEATSNGLSFDEVTWRLRDELERPPQVDVPPPLGGEAVSVLTIHQAKGLEWPVVILWDPTQPKLPFIRKSPWWIDRDGSRWAASIEGLDYESTEGASSLDEDQLAHERRRLYYVAVTRARDKLVLPVYQNAKAMHAELVPKGAKDEHPSQDVWEVHGEFGSPWGDKVPPVEHVATVDDADPYPKGRAAWEDARDAAGVAIAKPIAVSTWAKKGTEEDGLPLAPVLVSSDESKDEEPAPVKPRRGRHGTTFGNTVHGALEMVLRWGVDADEAVARSAKQNRLEDKLVEEAGADVGRALGALKAEGLLEDDVELRCEYPVVGKGADGYMLVGVIDLIAVKGDETWIVDFKTDQPPTGDVEDELPGYVRQLRAYGGVVAGDEGARLALLFTAREAGLVAVTEGDAA